MRKRDIRQARKQAEQQQWETSPMDGEQWETSPMDGEDWAVVPFEDEQEQ